jgi:Acetyl-CoA dehydrogenase C-terminal like
VEQLYRDNRLNEIHEGTTGIQGLDLLGRKVRLRDGAEFAALCNLFERSAALAEERGGLAEYVTALRAAVRRLGDVTRILCTVFDSPLSLANSTLYLKAAGHITVAWVWLEQLLACGASAGDFYEGKRAAAACFFRYELPKVWPQLDLLEALDRTVLDCRPAWL